MDIQTLIVPITVIIGIVNGIKMATPKVEGFIAFLVALGLGVGMGVMHFYGLSVETGIVAALSSAGLYKLAKIV